MTKRESKSTVPADRARKVLFVPVSTEQQAEMVGTLAREIWTEHYTPIIGKEQVEYMLERFQSEEAILRQITLGILYFLITSGEELVGYIALHPRSDELFLSKIYVRADQRGRGYGKKAVQLAETLAHARHLKKIVLTVNKNNIDSIKAYERMGFKNTGSLIQDIGNGFVMDDYKMEKTI